MTDKVDLRTLKEAERFSLAKASVRMVNKGNKQKDVANLMGIRPTTISEWVKLYKEGGYNALRSDKKGAKPGKSKLINKEIESELQRLIIDKMPDQLKLNFALWTRKAVKELIKSRYGIDIAITTTGEYLRSWGFTPQKPKKQAYEQNDKKVQKWLKEEYPQIKQRAKEEGAEIHWGDETGVKNTCNHGRSYSPKGKTPIKKKSAKKITVNMISTVTNQGRVRFMIYEGKMHSKRLIEFLKRLIKSSKTKVFLILDNLKVHHSKLVKEWVKQHKQEIELFFLPSYSPEKNPDEYLNCDLKCEMSHKPAPKDKDELKRNVHSHMRSISKKPERIKRYFVHPDIAYAA